MLLGSFVFWGAAPAWAVKDRCISFRLEVEWVGYLSWDEDILPNVYAKNKNILVLSDGIFGRKDEMPLGPKLAVRHPSAKVTSADLAYPEQEATAGNFRMMQVDNRKPLPFKDNEFDAIILRNGMCLCEGVACCAGFEALSPLNDQFFREAVRVMDKANPESKIVLHSSAQLGRDKITSVDVDGWKRSLAKLEKEFNVEATVNVDVKGRFAMITIRPM